MEYLITIMFLPLFLLTVSVHEFSHGWVAHKLGDNTAKEKGRLTLNPLKHISLLLTIFLPATLIAITKGKFAIAALKPVPINPLFFRNPKRGLTYVGAAGPLSNLFLALVFSSFLRILPYYEDGFIGAARAVLGLLVVANTVLGLFNLMPVPPLDGSRIIAGLLPNRAARAMLRYDKYGVLFIVTLLAALALTTDGLISILRLPLKLIWKLYGLNGVEFDNLMIGSP